MGFLGPKIPFMFTSIVTHVYFIKKNHNQTRNFDTCEVFNGGFNYQCVTFSNNKGMVEQQK